MSVRVRLSVSVSVSMSREYEHITLIGETRRKLYNDALTGVDKTNKLTGLNIITTAKTRYNSNSL